jgi:ethanolamine ammonia-lyase small subunit
MSTPASAAGSHPATSIGEAAQKRHWVDHAARTTAVLAVLAAVSSGQYANQFSRTILAQAEASDQWSYYQAKSIKRHLVQGQVELLKAMAVTTPQAASALDKLQADDATLVKKYDQEILDAKAKADKIEADKRIHERQGNWFQGAFIILQAGVVLCTVASSAKRKELWALAIALGVAGLCVVGYGFLIGLRP